MPRFPLHNPGKGGGVNTVKIDRKKLKYMGTEPRIHTVRVDLYKLEQLGLYQPPIYESCPIKIDKKALKQLQSVPMPSGNTIKVDLNKMEALGIYQKPAEELFVPWYRRIRLFERFRWIINIPKKLFDIIKWPVKKFRVPEMSWSKHQIYMAAGIAASATMGICIMFCVNINLKDDNTKKVSVEYVQPVNEDTVAITYIDDIDLSKVGQLDLNIIGQFVNNKIEKQDDTPVIELSSTIPETEQSVMQDEDVSDTQVQEEEQETDIVTDIQEESQDQKPEDEEESQEQESIIENVEEESVNEESSEQKPEDEESSEQKPEDEEYLLAVANVEDTLNVRVEASEDSEKAGLMYKNCVGTILEQKDGWTKLESGELIGWVNDEYLLFNDEAKAVIEEAKNSTVTVDVVSLHVRQEPNANAAVVGYMNEGDTLTIVELGDNDWAEVEYKDSTAYINTKYIDIGSGIKTGETIEEIEKREREEAEAKKRKQEEAEAKKREQEIQNVEAANILNTDEATMEVAAELTVELVAESADISDTVGAGIAASQEDTNKIAAMIYCEAGNQSYEGQVAVGAVIVNRINSPKFPNTVEEVLRAPKQFSPVKSGKFDRVYSTGSWSSSAYEAALDAIAGEKGQVADCLYFKNPKIAGAHKGIHIGDHVFW